MGTTADKLNKLLATKVGIKSAIIEKGQAVYDSDTFASYENKIRAIKATATDDGAGNVIIAIPGANVTGDGDVTIV